MKRKRAQPSLASSDSQPCRCSLPQTCPVETANKLSTEEFVARYLSSEGGRRVLREIQERFDCADEKIPRRVGGEGQLEGGQSRNGNSSADGGREKEIGEDDGSGNENASTAPALHSSVLEGQLKTKDDERQQQNSENHRNGDQTANGNKGKEEGKDEDLLDCQIQVQHYSSYDLPRSDLETCLALVKQTSRTDYDVSHDRRWSTPAKRREMLTEGMRYTLLYISCLQTASSTFHSDSGTSHHQLQVQPKTQTERQMETERQQQKRKQRQTRLAGFVSYLPTHEPDLPVLYIYELHLQPQYQRHGLGKLLLTLVQSIAMNAGIEKIMLSVFRRNQNAWQWYFRRGFEVDAFSPENENRDEHGDGDGCGCRARKLRGGKVRRSSYAILSRECRSVEHDIRDYGSGSSSISSNNKTKRIEV